MTGAVYAECDSVLTFSGTNTFISNYSTKDGGGAIFATGTNINSALYCGAIVTFPSIPDLPHIFCGVTDTHTSGVGTIFVLGGAKCIYWEGWTKITLYEY